MADIVLEVKLDGVTKADASKLLAEGWMLIEHPQEPEASRWVLMSPDYSTTLVIEHSEASVLVAEQRVWVAGWGKIDGQNGIQVRYWKRIKLRRLSDG